MQEADRIKKLPPYLFARIEKKIDELQARGIDVISLGIGDPDYPTPEIVVEELCRQSQRPENHRYASSAGMMEFKKSVADWYHDRFDVSLDPVEEIVTLIGSKEGIAHISFCCVNPGDVNLVPDPGYPVYGIGTILAGGIPYLMELSEENGFLPDFDAVPKETAERARLMFLNYPNNPTGAVASLDFFEEAVAFARSNDIIICHDAAYSEIYFDDVKPPSILEIDGAMDVAVEFNSLSKPFNMTGWRIGWMSGNREVVEALGRLKSNLDSGVFQAVQMAGAVALKEASAATEVMRRVYRERRDMVCSYLTQMGWKTCAPAASFYVWVPVPEGYSSESFAEYILDKASVVLTPGNGYGRYGEGYFRISLTVATDRLEEAMQRMQKAL